MKAGCDGVPELDVLADDRFVVGERLRLVDLVRYWAWNPPHQASRLLTQSSDRRGAGFGLVLSGCVVMSGTPDVVASARRLAHGVDAEGGADQAEEGERQENVQAKLRRHAVSIGTSGSKA